MIQISNDLFYRKIERSDLVHRVEWINNPEINSTLTFVTPVSLASTEKWFESTITDNSKLNLSFFLKENDEYIPLGFSGFIGIDRNNRRAELFITIGNTTYQGRGLGKKIVTFLIRFGFSDLNLRKIYLTTLENNERAKKLYEACGFVQDGKLRQHFYHQGRYLDCYHMSLLRNDVE